MYEYSYAASNRFEFETFCHKSRKDVAFRQYVCAYDLADMSWPETFYRKTHTYSYVRPCEFDDARQENSAEKILCRKIRIDVVWPLYARTLYGI